MRRYTPQRRHRNHGVVIIITLLALMLMVAMVLFVMNLGHQVDRRVDTQGAADSAAAASSVHTARMLNLIAMNNVQMTRTIAEINVLDALAQATEFTFLEQSKIIESLEGHIDGPIYTEPGISGSQVEGPLREKLDEFREELQRELDLIEPVHNFFQANDIRNITHFNGPSGPGQLWQSMFAMDEINVAAIESLPSLAQLNGYLAARANMPDDESAEAMILRYDPIVPAQRGRFNDFRRPVRYGLLPPVIDTIDKNRGPWDTVFGWRHLNSHTVGGVWVPGSNSSSVSEGGSGNTPISGGIRPGNRGGRRVGGERVINSYSTYGPQTWLLRRISDYRWNHLRNTRLHSFTSQMANIKMNYLWGSGNIRRMRQPEWIVDFTEATNIADTNRNSIVETGWFILEIKSRYAPEDPNFMSPGSWSWHDDRNRAQPRISRRNRWTNPDPRDWAATIDRVDKVGDAVWRDVWEYEVTFDNALGIAAGTGAHTVYRVDHFFFMGVNVGPMVEVPNPYDGFDRNSTAAPAPVDLNHAVVTQEPAAKHAWLSHLAVAKHSDRPLGYQSQFDGNKPYPHMVAMAQARIFNTHSWDLWTQMWNAQLVPIDDYEAWVDRASLDDPTASNVRLQNPEDLVRYMTNIRELAPIMVSH